ncbi:MAG: hypothetical protein VYD34_05965 [Verrucomicrobiota bacterium]|nr:hypothetical protein [Verrucomicrobiota bacterium]
MKRFIPFLAAFALGGVIIGLVVHAQSRVTQQRLKRELGQQKISRDGKLLGLNRSSKPTQATRLADLEGKLLGQGLTEDEVAKVIGRMGVSASPEEIIDDLIWLAEQLNTQKSDDQHRLFIRQVIRQFEALTAIEREALPEIKAFLDELEEVIFRENTNELTSGNWRDGRIYFDPIFPPTMRIGLFNTVRRIGKNNEKAKIEAENVLLSTLSNTTRGLEVFYITQALEDLSGEKHKDAILREAKYLLQNPPETEKNENALYRRHRTWLYDLLRKYKDETYVEQAQSELLVENQRKDKEGNTVTTLELDSAAMRYITEVLGERAMPILRPIYEQNPELSDGARSAIRRVAASNMGRSSDADAITTSRFQEGLRMMSKTEDKNSVGRGNGLVKYYLTALTSGRGASKENIGNRRQYLSSLRSQTQNTEVHAMMDKVDKRLVTMLDPEKAKKLERFSLDNREKRR